MKYWNIQNSREVYLTVRTKDGETIRVIALVYWFLLLSDYFIKNNKKMTILVTCFVVRIAIIFLLSYGTSQLQFLHSLLMALLWLQLLLKV